VIKETRMDALWGIAELMDRALATVPPPISPPDPLWPARRDHPKPPPAAGWTPCRVTRAPPGGLPDGWHMLTRDLQAETVLTDIASWLADPLAALPPGSRCRGACRGSAAG